MSIVETTASETVPARVTPGQRMTAGTRIPPSWMLPLPALSGALLVGVVPSTVSYMLPPLSDQNTMTVLSARSCCSRWSSTRPRLVSKVSSIAPMIARSWKPRGSVRWRYFWISGCLAWNGAWTS